MFSGKIIFNFGIAERLRTLRYSIFTGRGHPFRRYRASSPKGEPLGAAGNFTVTAISRPLGEGGIEQSEMTERVSLRTLPKKAGNISLSLREWGLFCIESRLQGAGGV